MFYNVGNLHITFVGAVEYILMNHTLTWYRNVFISIFLSLVKHREKVSHDFIDGYEATIIDTKLLGGFYYYYLLLLFSIIFFHRHFNGEECHSLKGKPKIFLLQVT